MPENNAAQGGPTGVLPGVKNVVAVASGKGGVGKSTVAANLALALKEQGNKVGLLDADVYGPSMAIMFGLKERLHSNVPLEAHGVKVLSMGSIVDPDRPVIWRGPMVHGALQQFLRDFEWGELDHLVIDMPPGTGDAQISISQILAVTGAVIVTTPQDVSIVDARKGLATFRQLKVPVLGIVENMSYFLCPHCGERTDIFRHGGGRRTAGELGTAFLGEIPIDPEVAVGGDEGRPIMAARPDSPAARAYREVAERVAAQLERARSEKAPQHSPIMPGKIEWK